MKTDDKKLTHIKDPALRRQVKALCERSTDLALSLVTAEKQGRLKEAAGIRADYHRAMEELHTIRPALDRASEVRQATQAEWHKKMARGAARKAA